MDWVVVVIMAANVLLVAVTCRYVHLTSRLVVETRKTRLSVNQAIVVADVVSVDSLLMLKVANIGGRPATDISIVPDGPVYNHKDEEITSLGRIAGLGPGQQRRYILDFAPDYFKKGRPDEITLDVSWTDPLLGLLGSVCRVDVGSYRDTPLQYTEEERYHAKLIERLDAIIKQLS